MRRFPTRMNAGVPSAWLLWRVLANRERSVRRYLGLLLLIWTEIESPLVKLPDGTLLNSSQR